MGWSDNICQPVKVPQIVQITQTPVAVTHAIYKVVSLAVPSSCVPGSSGHREAGRVKEKPTWLDLLV